MQITCEKCQTSYEVDDKLIPPGGAPVQCTKCGNLFTAYPLQVARAPAKTVMMFAAEPAPPAVASLPRASDSNTGSAFRAATASVPVAPGLSAALPAPSPNTPAWSPGSAAPSWGAPASAVGSAPAVSPTAFTAVTKQDLPVAGPSGKREAFGPGMPRTAAIGQNAPTPQGLPVMEALPAAVLDEPLTTTRPGRLTQMFFSQGEAVEAANLQASKAATGEANRRPGQTQMFMQAENFEQELVRKSRLPLYLGLGVAGLVLLGVGAALVLPGLMGPPGADRQAVSDHDTALTLLRKDDPPSLVAADKQLAGILARKPHYVEARADRALLQQFLADDRLWQAERLKAAYDGLFKHVQQLSQHSDPQDAELRAKDVTAMTGINRQYDTLGKEANAFEVAAGKLIEEAKVADPTNPAVLRARGFIAADHDQSDNTQKLVKLYLHEVAKPRDGWSELILAELATSGKASEEKRQDGIGHIQNVVALDPSLVRARYLRVRLDVMNKKEAAAKDDVGALAAANANHLGGAALLAGLEEELGRERAEKEVRDARVAAEAKASGGNAPAPPATGAPAAKKSGKPAARATPKRTR